MFLSLLAQATKWNSAAVEVPMISNFIGIWSLIVVVVVVVFVLLGITVCVLLNVISSQQKAERELQFKRELLDRGLSADEVTKIIEATPLPSDGFSRYWATKGKKGS